MRDILLDSENDLLLNQGDFVLGDATAQSIGLLLLFQKGELRASPLMGVGLINWLLSEGSLVGLKHEVAKQFAADGGVLRTLRIQEGGQIEIDVVY